MTIKSTLAAALVISRSGRTIGPVLLFLSLFGLLQILPSPAPAQQADRRSRVQYYINNFGLVSPQTNPRVAIAQAVFERVRGIADKRSNQLPRLVVIRSKGDPWALALPDGHVVVTEQAVEVCFKKADHDQSRARLAFIFGHELAHLAKDDFWDMEVFAALDGKPGCERLVKILKGSSDIPRSERREFLAAARRKEMQADDWGFFYAAAAGYRIDLLIDRGGGSGDFFRHWMAQTSTGVHPAYPKPRDRARLLEVRFSELSRRVDFFHFGTRLACFGQYDDAINFYRHLLKKFPSREIMNNLGYCHLQLALGSMDPKVAYRFWLPTKIDLRSGMRSRGIGAAKGWGHSKEVLEHLKQAVHYFEQALDADETYGLTWVNLAAAQFYLGEIFMARAAIEKALKFLPGDKELLGFRALIILSEGPGVDMWPTVRATLELLTNQPDAPLSALYNLARLKSERGRSGGAQAAWRRLAESSGSLPEPYRGVVLRELGQEDPEAATAAGAASPRPPWGLPRKVRVGLDLTALDQGQNPFKGWRSMNFDWGSLDLSGRILTHKSGDQVLVQDDFVEMIVLKKGSLGTGQDLLGKVGQPWRKDPLPGAELWLYGQGWAALVKNGRVVEAWIKRGG